MGYVTAMEGAELASVVSTPERYEAGEVVVIGRSRLIVREGP